MRLGDGVARVSALRDGGVRVALGTDGRGCDETLDMLELMKMVALVQKARGGDFSHWLTAREAFAMGTENGSVCTGHGEHLGRIEEGARGDLVLFKGNSLPFTPLHDPMRQLVFGVASDAVRTVVVDGRLVVDRGRLVGIDEDKLLERVRAHIDEAPGPKDVGDASPLERRVQELYERAERAQLGIDFYVRS
jgi:guanine deaminase